MRGAILAAVLLGLSAIGGALAQSAKPTRVTDFNMVLLPTFAAADLGSERSDIVEAELAGQALPWPILEVSDNGMYLVEFKSDHVWVVDSLPLPECAQCTPPARLRERRAPQSPDRSPDWHL